MSTEKKETEARHYFARSSRMSKEDRSRLRRELRNVPILSVCEELGISYRKNGNSSRTFCLEDHDSCVIWPDRNTFKRFSTGDSGDAVAFLMTFGEEFTGNRYFNSLVYSMRWIQEHLADEKIEIKEMFQNISGKKRKLVLPERSSDNLKAVSYLRDQRGICEEVILRWIRDGNLYEGVHKGRSRKTGRPYELHNCVFIAKDENGTPYQGMQRSTLSAPGSGGKWDLEGNDYSRAFCFGDPSSSRSIVVTEAVIDAMSLQTIYRGNPYYEESCYVSLNGAQKYDGLISLVKNSRNIDDVTLCLDRDEAGEKASKEIAELIRGIEDRHARVDLHFPPTHKDWNEELTAGYNPHGRTEFISYLAEKGMSYDDLVRSSGKENSKRIEKQFLYPSGEEKKSRSMKR